MSCYESVVDLRVGGVAYERGSGVSVAIFGITRYATVLVGVTYVHQLFGANVLIDAHVSLGAVNWKGIAREIVVRDGSRGPIVREWVKEVQ